MVSAAELIEALQRRLRLVAPHLRRAPGEFPPGWQAWLEQWRERPGRITGASAASLVATLAQRPLATPPKRLAELNRWEAFSTLWRQQWHPPAREDRNWRWFAGAVSVLWHLLFGTLLLWLMMVHHLANPPRAGETVTQVEWIGTGTPDEEAGGGAVAEPAPAAEAGQGEPAESPVRPSPPPESVAVDTPLATPPTAQSEPEPAPTEQPVSVSEPAPDRSDEFVLPPPVPRAIQPTVAAPELRAPTPSVQMVEIPAPLAAPEVPAAEVTVPALSQRIPDVARREVPMPLRAPTPTVAAPSIKAPEHRSRIPQVRAATIPTPAPPSPAPTSAPSAASSADASQSAAVASQAAVSSSAPAPPGGRTSPTTAAGAGAKPTPAPGGWTTPIRGDDWGDAARDTPGAQSGDDGLYNSDGSVRLAETPGSAAPGAPPGTITDEIVNLDRAGTWLKRPPIDYEPTAFDKYWRPNETLLEEWVRKSITTVRIPIPGTNKHIVCQTVLLALGGGCGITDPDLNEQSARARPPPDIPFKPELQEDNGSIRPPPGG